MPHRRDLGLRWDTAEIRREREFGWFRQHEAELIEEARRRRREAQARESAARMAKLRADEPWRCPRCRTEMQRDRIEDIEVEKCPSCQGIFFRRGELEEVLLRHDAHRRGFFRQLLGFRRDS